MWTCPQCGRDDSPIYVGLFAGVLLLLVVLFSGCAFQPDEQLDCGIRVVWNKQLAKSKVLCDALVACDRLSGPLTPGIDIEFVPFLDCDGPARACFSYNALGANTIQLLEGPDPRPEDLCGVLLAREKWLKE